MPGYPQLARLVTDLRRQGDIEGAITAFKAAPDAERRLPEVRSAMAWVIYDRDIKPCAATDINVTPEMIDTAVDAVGKIRTWCQHDLTSRFSPYPQALLATAKQLKNKELWDQLRELLLIDEANEFIAERDSQYPSPLERWIGLALDGTKEILEYENLTPQRCERAAPLLTLMAQLEQLRKLPGEKSRITINGKNRTLPSLRQRYYLQHSKYLAETARTAELITLCRNALEGKVFEGDNNRRWILYRLSVALLETAPEEALEHCEEFLALEYRPYSVLLKARILLALGRHEDAIRETAHSLQITDIPDLPFITANLTQLADLTNDVEVKKAHIQMVRAIRSERGYAPSADIEARAAELGLGHDEPTPSPAVLRSMWNAINPNPRQPMKSAPREKRQPKQATPAGRPSRQEIARLMRNQAHRGTVGLASIALREGEAKRRPVVVLGSDDTHHLVGMLFTSSKHPKAFPLQHWQEAGINAPSNFAPVYAIIAHKDLRRLGTLQKADLDRLPTN